MVARAEAILVRRNLPSHGEERAPKSGKVRSVPLIDQAAKALDGLSRRPLFTQPGDRVFCSDVGDVLDDGLMRDEFYAALKVAIWPLHDLQACMGHADIQTTMIYVHHVPKTASAAELTRAVEAAMGGESVSPDASRTGENGAQLRDTDSLV